MQNQRARVLRADMRKVVFQPGKRRQVRQVCKGMAYGAAMEVITNTGRALYN